ncbi:MAG: hypothetical protein ACTSRD_08895 [Promethearchaeota archaeon]
MVEKEKLSKIIKPYLDLEGVDFVAIVDFQGSLFYSEVGGKSSKSEDHLNELIKSVIETITDKYNAGSLYTDNQRIVFIGCGIPIFVCNCGKNCPNL